jgi:DNA transformation protein
MCEGLTEFPNLGPASARMLAAAGIDTPEQLRELGPVLAFLAVRQAGQKPSMNLLWAIAAGLKNRHWSELSQRERQHLQQQLRQLAR